ncbi:hypothetical protein B0H13DRAFT_2007823 [Mycena leptocephala]|nr:hypothetical protein B0H13DRAFT_2007823 [Mycena leptocephala]
MVACVTGLRFLETTGAFRLLSFLCALTIEGCESPLNCTESRINRRFEADLWRRYSPKALANPHLAFGLWRTSDWDVLDLCTPCISSMKTIHRKAEQMLWDALPEIFDLPNWAELEKMEIEALQ